MSATPLKDAAADWATALHAAHCASLEASLVALRRHAAIGIDHPNHMPDGIRASLTPDGIEIEYLRGSQPICGEAW